MADVRSRRRNHAGAPKRSRGQDGSDDHGHQSHRTRGGTRPRGRFRLKSEAAADVFTDARIVIVDDQPSNLKALEAVGKAAALSSLIRNEAVPYLRLVENRWPAARSGAARGRATWALRSSSQNPNSEAARTIDAVAGKLLDMSARRIRLPVVNIAKPS